MDVEILQWLCESGALTSLQRQCQCYRKETGQALSVFSFSLLIDTMQLLEHNAKLGELVMHQPGIAWPLFQQVCYIAVTVLEWLPELKFPSQLVLLIRLNSLPCLPGYIVEHVCDLPLDLQEPRFCQITGTIYSMTMPEKYTEHAVFSCSTEGCSCGEESSSHFISVHVAGASEVVTAGGDWTCCTCGAPLVEDVTCRTLDDKLYIMLVPCDWCDTPLTHFELQRLQGVCVVVRKDLCSGLRLGARVTVIGAPTHKLVTHSQQTFINSIIEANNISMELSQRQKLLPSMPRSILHILKACEYSHWAFSATLAFSFAADICPPGSYHRLKMCLLLSLVSSIVKEDSRKKHVLDFLAYGSDTVTIHQLLKVASALDPNPVHHTSLNDLVASLRRNNMGTFIDAGSLLLAHDGVCVIENLGSLKKDVREILKKAMERDRVVLNVPRQKQKGETKAQELSWPLSCKIWALVDQQDRKKSLSKADSEVLREYSLQDTSVIDKGLVDHFGLVVVNDPTDLSSQEHLHDVMMSHIMSSSRSGSSPPLLPLVDLHQYLCMASVMEVELNEDASILLQDFYVASRRVRMSASRGMDIPIGALNSMNAIACAHAKLNLKKKAAVEDAVISIYLYEESLTSRFGYSVLGLSPCLHFKANSDPDRYIGREFDESLRLLHKQIVDFCKCHRMANIHQHEE